MAQILNEKMVLEQISNMQIKKITENPELAALMEVQHEVHPEMPPDWKKEKFAKENMLGWGSWSFSDPMLPAFTYLQAQKLQLLQNKIDHFAEQAKVQSFKVLGVLMLVLAVLAKIADWSSFETVQIGVLLMIIVKFWEVGDAMILMKVMISKIAAGTDHLRYVVSNTGGNQVARASNLLIFFLKRIGSLIFELLSTVARFDWQILLFKSCECIERNHQSGNQRLRRY
jgi:hypothetical protein